VRFVGCFVSLLTRFTSSNKPPAFRRVCLLGFMDIPCKCASTKAYRELAAGLLNAGHEAAKKQEELDGAGATNAIAAAGVGAAAAALVDPPRSVGVTLDELLLDDFSSSSSDEKSVLSTSKLPVSPVPAMEDPTAMLQPDVNDPLDDIDDDFINTVLTGVPGTVYTPETDLLSDAPVPTFDTAPLADDPQPATLLTFGMHDNAREAVPKSHVPPNVMVNPRPHKFQRTSLFFALVFAFALLSVPMWQDAAPVATSTPIQLGGVVPRGVSSDGGYYVATGAVVASPQQAYTPAPATHGTGRVLSSATPYAAALAQSDDTQAAMIAPPKTSDASVDGEELMAEDVAQGTQMVPYTSPVPTATSQRRSSGTAKPVLRGKPSGALPVPQSPFSNLRVLSEDDRTEEGVANITLVPASAPRIVLDDNVPGFIELTKPLQRYANSVFSSFVDSEQRNGRRRRGSSNASASFVMCPEAVGSLSSLTGAAGVNDTRPSAQRRDVALRGQHSSQSSFDSQGAEPSAFVLLMVPSASLHSSSDRSGWVEIGCEVRSIRHVQSVHLPA